MRASERSGVGVALLRAMNPILEAAFDAASGKLGIGPLPCFIADRRPQLMRLAPPNPDFATGLWVLTHPDIRHVPRVRAFMDYCSGELMRHRPLIEGGA